MEAAERERGLGCVEPGLLIPLGARFVLHVRDGVWVVVGGQGTPGELPGRGDGHEQSVDQEVSGNVQPGTKRRG
jgi:hypothetical protein